MRVGNINSFYRKPLNSNPCYLTAYEAHFCLEWDPAETTLISLGTGREPHTLQPGDADRFWAWDWIGPVLGAFLQSADDQQVHLVRTFFEQLDFRRFQVDFDRPIAMDDVSNIPELTAYGDEMGRKILNDETDRAMEIKASLALWRRLPEILARFPLRAARNSKYVSGMQGILSL